MKVRIAFVCSVSACAISIGAPAFGQDASAADSNGNDIIVTARRVEERLQDVPISISVFNQEQITSRNIVSAGDLGTYTPSLTANARFGANNTSFAIRGFVQENTTAPSVAVYFADVSALRSNGSTTSGNGAGPGAFFDLQNVQVLKGPQGTLFGRNTTGGAILLVPQKPTDKLEGYVEGSIGNYDMRRVQAVLNAPLADTIRVRLGVDRQVRDGYLKNVSPVGPRDFNDVDYWSLRGSVVIDLTPDLENYTVATWNDSNTSGDYPKIFINLGGSAATGAQLAATSGDFYDIQNGSPYAEERSRQWQVINTTTWKASDTITIKNIASYGQVRAVQSTNLFGDYTNPTGNPPLYNYSVTIVTVPGSHAVAQSTFTEELQLQGGTSDNRFVYQLGGYLELSRPLDGFQRTRAPIFLSCTDVNSLQCVDLVGRSFGLEGFVGSIQQATAKYRFNNQGLYAQGTFKITDRLSLTAGARYTWDKSSGLSQTIKVTFPAANTPAFGCQFPVPLVIGGTSAQIVADPTRCNFPLTQKSSKPTWLIDFDYKPIDDVLLYAKYARGYRQGGVNVTTPVLPSWSPEKVDTFEVGMKASFNGAVSGTFNIAAFHNNFTNQQLQANGTACTAAEVAARIPQCPFAGVPAAGIGNAGKSTIDGIEVDASVTPVQGLRFDGGYAYLDTKLKSITAPVVPLGYTALVFSSVLGSPLTLTPKHKISLSGSYTLPLPDSIGRISLGATYTYQSKVANTPTAAPGFTTLPGRSNLNLNANWNDIGGSSLDLALFATNVTKEKYFNVTIGSTFGADAAFLNQPRMFGARLRYRFGD